MVWIDIKAHSAHPNGAMVEPPRFIVSEVAERLRLIRESMPGAPSQEAFANMHGFTGRQVGNWETGYQVIPHQKAITLVVRNPGLTLDWIYFGSRAGLTVEMATRLGVVKERPLRSGSV